MKATSAVENREVREYPDMEALNRAVAEEIAGLSDAAVKQRGRFNFVLSGGNTPRHLYQLLARDYRDRIPWPQVHLFWGDERYLPPDNPKSNYRMVREALLDLMPLTPAHVHPMPTNFPQPDEAARAYEATLHSQFPATGPEFDLVLLGVGVEGHTASLFPGSPALEEKTRWVAAVRAPVEPAVRLSLTLPAINRARNVFFLVVGADKQEIVRTLLKTPTADLREYPAALVCPAGRLVWFLDKAANG
jgi:6-phosphogluconolactonase